MSTKLKMNETLKVVVVRGYDTKFEVELKFNNLEQLFLNIQQHHPDGEHKVLNAVIHESYESGESYNDVELETYLGTNSRNDKLNITFHTKDDEDENYQDEIWYDRSDVLNM